MNTHSDYRASLTFVPEFDAEKPTVAEMSLLEALIPELMTALLDLAPQDED